MKAHFRGFSAAPRHQLCWHARIYSALRRFTAGSRQDDETKAAGREGDYQQLPHRLSDDSFGVYGRASARFILGLKFPIQSSRAFLSFKRLLNRRSGEAKELPT
jgi:hypothetical protein